MGFVAGTLLAPHVFMPNVFMPCLDHRLDSVSMELQSGAALQLLFFG
jgi:hypothetical protein